MLPKGGDAVLYAQLYSPDGNNVRHWCSSWKQRSVQARQSTNLVAQDAGRFELLSGGGMWTSCGPTKKGLTKNIR